MLVDKHKSTVFDGGRTHADHFLECTHTRAPKGATRLHPHCSAGAMGRVVPLGIDYTQTAADQLPVCNHAPNTHSKSNKTTDEREVQTFVHPGTGRNGWTHLLLQNFQEMSETVGLISYSKISRKWAKQLDSSPTPKFPGNGRHNWTHLLPQNFQEMGETVADHIRNPRDLINNYSPKKDDQIDQKITIYR